MIELKKINILYLLFAGVALIFAPIIIIALIAFSKYLKEKLTRIYEKYGRDIATKLISLSGFSGIVRILRIRT